MYRKAFLITGIFAIAMAFLESAVVVYLRTIYYPAGFIFPLKPISGTIAVTEFIREAATMVMLITIAFLAAKNALTRFAFFIFAFAIWDIFYYIFLYFLLGWPSSWLTWDLLFLIPCPWTGPVVAPVINSLTMILLAFLIVRCRQKNESFRINLWEWVLMILGSLITITGYTMDYLQFMHSRFQSLEFLTLNPSREILDYSSRFMPEHFNWLPFLTGEILFLLSILNMTRRLKISHPPSGD